MSLEASNAVINDGWYKGKPTMRVWELDKDSTRYDVITAGPSDDDLMKYWWTWSVVALLVGTASLIIFFAIAFSKKARKNPFNVYLLYLSVPDFVFSLCCGITCLMNAVNGEYWAEWMCIFQQWYCVFGIGSNAWLNACITFELYKMLKFSNIRKRYKSPSRIFVSKQAVAVYLFMGFLGTWGAIDAPNWPFHAGATSGLACLPIEVDHASSIFFWLVFFPLFAGIPSVYITYVSYKVWRHTLLPPTGKRRLLAIYFGRLILVFYVMWLPTLLILFAFSSFVPPWVHFVGGLWSHLQGFVSAAVSLMKPDIYKATVNLLTCQCGKGEDDVDDSHRRRRPHNPASASIPAPVLRGRGRRRSSMDNPNQAGSSVWSDWFSMLSFRSPDGLKTTDKSNNDNDHGNSSHMIMPPGDTENPSTSRRSSPIDGEEYRDREGISRLTTNTNRSSLQGSMELWPSQQSLRCNSRVDSIASSRRNSSSAYVLEDLEERTSEEAEAEWAEIANEMDKEAMEVDEHEDEMMEKEVVVEDEHEDAIEKEAIEEEQGGPSVQETDVDDMDEDCRDDEFQNHPENPQES